MDNTIQFPNSPHPAQYPTANDAEFQADLGNFLVQLAASGFAIRKR